MASAAPHARVALLDAHGLVELGHALPDAGAGPHVVDDDQGSPPSAG